MGHIPDDENFDDCMSASAEEWSKPEQPAPRPQTPAENKDRWGSTIPDKASADDASRWGSEPIEPTRQPRDPQVRKAGSKWWIIVAIVAIVLCLCVCLVVFGLPYLGYNIFQGNLFQF